MTWSPRTATAMAPIPPEGGRQPRRHRRSGRVQRLWLPAAGSTKASAPAVIRHGVHMLLLTIEVDCGVVFQGIQANWTCLQWMMTKHVSTPAGALTREFSRAADRSCELRTGLYAVRSQASAGLCTRFRRDSSRDGVLEAKYPYSRNPVLTSCTFSRFGQKHAYRLQVPNLHSAACRRSTLPEHQQLTACNAALNSWRLAHRHPHR